MASKTPQTDSVTEACDECGRETTHSVSVELRTESSESENAEFSREPYRIVTCRSCGSETSQRMNNA